MYQIQLFLPFFPVDDHNCGSSRSVFDDPFDWLRALYPAFRNIKRNIKARSQDT